MTPNKNIHISGTPYSVEAILCLLQEKTKNKGYSYHNVDWENVIIKDISDGQGFISLVKLIKFAWKHQNSLFSSLVLKSVNVHYLSDFINNEAGDELSDSQKAWSKAYIPEAHKHELVFYQKLACLEPTLKVPRFYFGSEIDENHPNGLILMEDLTQKGKTTKMIPGFSNEQVESLIDELAKIHHASWKNTEWLESFEADFKNQKIMDYIWYGWVAMMRENSEKCRGIIPEIFNPLMDRAHKLFTRETRDLVFYVGEKYGIPPTLVHGDMWSANVLFKLDENGNPGSKVEAVIDWQLCQPGNPCVDICHILAINTSANYRRQNTTGILQRYYNNLKRLNGTLDFTFKQLEYAHRMSMGYVMMFFTCATPWWSILPAVVGGQNKDELRTEYLDRVVHFVEDTLEVFGV